MEKIKLCTGYRQGGKTLTDLPFGPSDLSLFEPVYAEFAGWKQDLGAVRKWQELPLQAQEYLGHIASLAGVPVKLVSVGPEREQVVEKR
jgi:adenylosuccinate synthase